MQNVLSLHIVFYPSDKVLNLTSGNPTMVPFSLCTPGFIMLLKSLCSSVISSLRGNTCSDQNRFLNWVVWYIPSRAQLLERCCQDHRENSEVPGQRDR